MLNLDCLVKDENFQLKKIKESRMTRFSIKSWEHFAWQRDSRRMTLWVIGILSITLLNSEERMVYNLISTELSFKKMPIKLKYVKICLTHVKSYIHALGQYVYRLIFDLHILQRLLIGKRTLKMDLCNLRMGQMKKWVRVLSQIPLTLFFLLRN